MPKLTPQKNDRYHLVSPLKETPAQPDNAAEPHETKVEVRNYLTS